uniref:Putative secreted protein n=1 Tax=Anopheles darlingi TaxID=43151 RepID=A0A2M4D6Y5_ANODA
MRPPTSMCVVPVLGAPPRSAIPVGRRTLTCNRTPWDRVASGSGRLCTSFCTLLASTTSRVLAIVTILSKSSTKTSRRARRTISIFTPARRSPTSTYVTTTAA